MNRRVINHLHRLALAGLFLAAVAAPVAAQQQEECVDLKGMPPGLYVTVQQNEVFLIKDGKMVELKPGEAGFASESALACLKVPPRMLDWPCNTSEAMARRLAPAYTIEDLPAIGAIREVVRRYFEENKAISPQVIWLNGESHGEFPAVELEALDSSAYWYIPGSDDPFASPKRPKIQLVSLFWATGQAVVDRNTLTALEIAHPDGEIPVAFMFNKDSEVPVSFFGPNPTLEQISKAYLERGIELAPVPVWYAGDHHFKASLKELKLLFDLPKLESISPERQESLRAELKAYGFFHKPIGISIIEETGTMIIDQPDVVAVAADMGITSFPIVMFYFNNTSHLAGCGISLPQISVVGGATSAAELTGTASILVPPQISIPPQLPDPERPQSGS